jgi:hypothetical protein
METDMTRRNTDYLGYTSSTFHFQVYFLAPVFHDWFLYMIFSQPAPGKP